MPEPVKEPVEKPALLNGSIRIDLGDNKSIDVDPTKITVSDLNVPVVYFGSSLDSL